MDEFQMTSDDFDTHTNQPITTTLHKVCTYCSGGGWNITQDWNYSSPYKNKLSG